MQTHTPHSEGPKSERFNLRIHPQRKRLIERAAALDHTTPSEFITRTAVERAEKIVTEQCHFFLDTAEWEKFCDALDAPPRTIPEFEKLLSEETVLDRMK